MLTNVSVDEPEEAPPRCVSGYMGSITTTTESVGAEAQPITR